MAKFPADWYTPAKYYVNSQYKNEFAWIWHQLGLQNRAYGFAYDDVNDQSAVKILGNSQPLTSMTITIYPFVSTTHTVVPNQKTAGDRPPICYVADNKVVLQSAVPIDKISLVSMNGRAVHRNLSLSRNVINTAGLAAGTYCIRLTDRLGNTSAARFVKSR